MEISTQTENVTILILSVLLLLLLTPTSVGAMGGGCGADCWTESRCCPEDWLESNQCVNGDRCHSCHDSSCTMVPCCGGWACITFACTSGFDSDCGTVLWPCNSLTSGEWPVPPARSLEASVRLPFASPLSRQQVGSEPTFGDIGSWLCVSTEATTATDLVLTPSGREPSSGSAVTPVPSPKHER